MQRICERAGVSRGAQTHHFPTRESLLIASVREIVNRYQFDLMHQDRRELTLHAFFDFLWDATFNDSLLTCWVEAMVAARTDPVLKQQVQVTDAAAIAAMKTIGVECASGSELVSTPNHISDIVELTVYLLRGMKVQDCLNVNREERQRLFQVWKSLIAEYPPT
jgi:AcrR family transcriptional regulator